VSTHPTRGGSTPRTPQRHRDQEADRVRGHMRRYPRFVLLIEAAAAAPTTQPWWGIPAFTLGGAVLGAVTTQGFTVLNHRRKATDDKKAASEQLRP
jgi:hypothetical protein